MNHHAPQFWIFCLAWLVPQMLCAQHYVTEVYLHDKAQRLFPVEAARVLAWMNRTESEKLSEVTWSVLAQPDGACTWKLAWLNSNGKKVHTTEVSYAADSLSRGAVHYRKAWESLTSAISVQVDGQNPTLTDLSEAFWQGIGSAGHSRLSAVAAGRKHASQTDPTRKAIDAAKLAGQLTQGAMPVLEGSSTLDHVLLARAAAWLCHAEKLAGITLEREWCVIGYLAGREIPASRAWNSVKGGYFQNNTAWEWWNYVLGHYPASLRDLALFAAQAQRLEYGLPFLLSHLRFETGAKSGLEEVLGGIYQRKLFSLTDCAPLLSETYLLGGLRGNCIMLMRRAQEEWMEELASMQGEIPAPLEKSAPSQSGLALIALRSSLNPPAIIPGLDVTGKLIEMGSRTHGQPLRPLAVARREDLLVHGWETSALNWRQLYRFLAKALGVKEEADKLAKEVCASAPSLAFTMQDIHRAPLQFQSVPIFRLEYLDQREVTWPLLFAADQKSPITGMPANSGCFLRNWTRTGYGAWQLWQSMLPSTPNEKLTVPFYRMAVEQGGEGNLAHAWAVLAFLPDVRNLNVVKNQEPQLLSEIVNNCPNAYLLHRNMLRGELQDAQKISLEGVQRFEELYWKSPGRNDISFIMSRYT
ncbi:MAG: hypothetical protein IPK32_04225 [Verrucomicrobiaceae bacterium]|nr:hypothetical protein [Verrucomicrobiaceae bacterium]